VQIYKDQWTIVSNSERILGIGYYKKFMNIIKIWSTSVKKVDINRTKWATFNNVKKMYDCIYPELVDCGIAVENDTKDY
jgi:hypothetical protein